MELKNHLASPDVYVDHHNRRITMPLELILQLPWYKIPAEEVVETMAEIASWGVRKLVAPQYFHHPDESGNGGFAGRMNELAGRYGMKIAAAHALLGLDYDLGCAGEKAMDEHKRYLYDLATLGVGTYTAHSGAHHLIPSGREPDEAFWSNFTHSMELLLPVLEEAKITMALENIYEPIPVLERMVKTVLSFNHPNLGFCLDSGHANIRGNGLINVLALFAPRMVTCHLHDNDGIEDLHAAPGTGDIDWTELNNELRAIPSLIHMETEAKPYSREIWNDYLRRLGF